MCEAEMFLTHSASYTCSIATTKDRIPMKHKNTILSRIIDFQEFVGRTFPNDFIRNSENTIISKCYLPCSALHSLTFYLVIYDTAAIAVISLLTGYFWFAGANYCTHPNLQFITGATVAGEYLHVALSVVPLIIELLEKAPASFLFVSARVRVHQYAFLGVVACSIQMRISAGHRSIFVSITLRHLSISLVTGQHSAS
ncbi:unnamed protein product [Heligmosomoides polygyrus]|uniref:7TM_GPCR_Srx domain-containing protein n=1 Tax=Heligmosomoides polygyrus TaxID=6339 RepID=A0A183G912_HELPZ|nr:unnamed protein product [Heligmosomoides polygyrus]